MSSGASAIIKIVFVLPTLKMGGAERVTLTLIRNLDKTRYNCKLVVCRMEGELLSELPSGLLLESVDTRHSYRAGFKLAKTIKKSDADLVVSIIDDVHISVAVAKLVLALQGKRIATIAVSHCTISRKEELRNSINGRLRYYLLRVALSVFGGTFYRFVVISKQSALDYRHILPHLGKKIVTLYNAAFDDTLYMKMNEPLHSDLKALKPYIVACGRLEINRGLEFLIRAFPLITQKVGDHLKLVIIGEGSLRMHLKTIVKQLGIESVVHFTGMQINPFPIVKNAVLYVHPALTDGLPTTLIEAMACGTPVVSTNCPSGPAEIIEHDISGILVNSIGDPDALAEATVKLLLDPEKSEKLRVAARQRAELFHAKCIAGKYEQLFDAAVARKGYIND